MKYSRLILGIVVVLVGLWVVVGEQMAGASADAVVNARVVTLRADVAGVLSLTDRALGSSVSTGETMFSIANPIVDNVRLNDLLTERELAVAEKARIDADLSSTIGMRAALMDRTEVFQAHRVAEMETRLRHAEDRLAMLQDASDAEVAAAATIIRAASPKRGKTTEPQADLPRARDVVIDRAREEVETLQIALDAARRGVFLGDGYNDSPIAEQRAMELQGRIDTLEASSAHQDATIAAWEQRISRERLRVNGLEGGDIQAPVNGLYWDVLQSNHVTVQQGDPVLRLVDCGSVVVTLSVTERVYDTLRVGNGAEFRLLGENKVYPATVLRLAGSGAATLYEHLAVAPSQKHLQRYDVVLMVPGLAEDAGAGCGIGRTGRAFFNRRPLDWLRGWFG